MRIGGNRMPRLRVSDLSRVEDLGLRVFTVLEFFPMALAFHA
jgi:hypothetical protein